MIRAATEADFDRILELGRSMQAESWYAYLAYDDVKIRAVLGVLVSDGFAMVHEEDGVVDGFFLGHLSELWFCRELCACDLALYVSPDRRGGIIGTALVNAFIVWANDRGAAEISLAVSTGVHPEATGRLFERMGGKHVGGIYKIRGLQCAKA